ncbi:MAG: hypothetical protein JWO15_3758, partial [Sphingomonadales bacterium]|nr:hypothetical protein [Sphingomonadales bacterium]
MSTTIDTKVVEAKFDNKQFESGVSATLSSLQKLKESLKLTGAAKGLEDVGSAASKFSLGGMVSSISGVGHSFSAMSVVGVTALATLTSKAISAGASMVKSLTLSPVTAGFHEYETKLGSIQTVLANTSKYGTTLPQVNAALNELNTYADKTIYDFGEMTKNVGLFTNSGMRVQDATKVIEGFSNEAAASGTSAEGAAAAAYQLSQAMSAGTIRLMDFRSLTNVGMGNKNMQNGLIEIAGAMGTLNKHGETAAKVQSNFNASLEKGWLSSDVMSNYLKIQAGALTVAQQKTLGLSDEQIAAFAKQQKMSEDAATKVRTFTQLIGTIREAVGSGWSATFEIMFGDFNEATALFTDINNAVSGFVNASANARNMVLTDFKALGGRTALIKGLEYAFRDLTGVITPIQRAFREIFPAKTGKDLADAAKAFENFTKGLKIGAETADNLKSTFAGVFAIFSIIGKVISGVVVMFVNLFSAFSGSGGSILAFTGHIGDLIVNFNNMLGQTKVISYFFANLGRVLATPVKALVSFATAIADMFSGFHPDTMNKLQSGLHGVNVTMTPLEKLAKGISTAFGKLGDMFDGAGAKIGKAMANIGVAIGKSITPETFSSTLSLINTALFGGIVLMIKNFFSKGINIGTGGGVFGQVKSTLSQLTNTLQTMQTAIKANILLQIAGALAILTASILVLSRIDGKALAKSMSALGIGFIGLEAAMKSLVSSIGPMAALKLPLITASMIGLAGAILLLSVAVKSMASLNLGDMLRGLLGIDLVLKTIGKTMENMPKGMIAQA